MSQLHENDIRRTGELTPLMIKFAMPCIVSLLVSALYNIVDQIFIANAAYLGSYGNAANSVVYPLTVVCIAIAITFGDGCGSFLSFSLGARKYDLAHKGVGTAISTMIVLGVILTVVYACFQDPLLTLFGGRVNDETFRLAKEYLTYLTIGVPFFMLGQSLTGMISADGSPHYAMIATLIGCAINCVLDPVLIYVIKWGMKGAAIATIAGQIVDCLILVAFHPKM